MRAVLVDIDAAFKTGVQFAHACKPGMGALNDPAKTTQSSLPSIPLRAIREVIPRRLRQLRHRSISSSLSACSSFGQPRGRSGFLPMAGKVSSNSSNTTESCRLAQVTHTAKGTPLRSTIRCCLLPGLQRSVAFWSGVGAPRGGHTSSVQAYSAQIQLLGPS